MPTEEGMKTAARRRDILLELLRVQVARIEEMLNPLEGSVGVARSRLQT
jgi:hypothetical protein